MNAEILKWRIKILKAIADPTRLRIIELLKGGERCVCELFPAVGKAQATVSKHLDVLYNAEILDRRVDGKRVFYRIRDGELVKLLDNLDGLVVKRLSKLTSILGAAPQPAGSEGG